MGLTPQELRKLVDGAIETGIKICQSVEEHRREEEAGILRESRKVADETLAAIPGWVQAAVVEGRSSAKVWRLLPGDWAQEAPGPGVIPNLLSLSPVGPGFLIFGACEAAGLKPRILRLGEDFEIWIRWN